MKMVDVVAIIAGIQISQAGEIHFLEKTTMYQNIRASYITKSSSVAGEIHFLEKTTMYQNIRAMSFCFMMIY